MPALDNKPPRVLYNGKLICVWGFSKQFIKKNTWSITIPLDPVFTL
jgi:hypothetical protein